MGRDTPYSEALDDLEADIGRRVMAGDDEGLSDEALAKRWELYRKGKDMVYYPSRTMELLHQEERLVRGVMGPVGCLAGDCRIWTERGLERMDDLYRKGENFRVWSVGASGRPSLEWASAPFIKGRESLLRVELENGGAFRGAGSHFVQTASLVWIRIRELKPGDRLRTTLVLYPPESLQDAARLMGIARDSLERCSEGSHQCDAQLRSSAAGAPTFVPSQHGARGESAFSRICRTFQGRPHSDSLCDTEAGRPSMPGWFARLCRAFRDRAPVGPDRKVCGYGGCKGCRTGRRSSQREDRQCTGQPCGSPVLLTQGEQAHPVGSSDLTYNSLGCVGVNIPSNRTEVYYDLTVESTANYIGEWGIVHHNSGKTTGVVADMNMRHLRQLPCRDGIVRDRFAMVRGTLTLLKVTLVDTWVAMFPKTNIKGSKYGVFGDLTQTRAGVRYQLELRGFGLDKEGALGNLLSNNFSGGMINEGTTISEKAKDGVVGRCGRYPDLRLAPANFKELPGAWIDKDGYWRYFKNHGVDMDTNAASEDSWWYKKSRDGGADPEREVYLEQTPAAFKVWDEQNERWKYELNMGQREGIPPAENIEHLPEHWDYYRNIIGSSNSVHIDRYVCCLYSKTEVGNPVFTDFSDRWHVAKNGVPWPAPGTRLVGGMDFGQTRRAVIGYLSPEGRLMVCAEAIDPTGSVETFANNVLRPMLGAHGFSVSDLTLFCDPAALNRSEHSELGGILLMRGCGFDAVPPAKLPNNDVGTRLEAVRHFLGRLVNNKGAVQIDPGCISLIRSVGGGYVWGRRKIGAEYMDTDEPAKNAHSHIADAFEYMCCGVRWGGDQVKLAEASGRQYVREGSLYVPKWQAAGDDNGESAC